MASTYETIMVEWLSRLKASGGGWVSAENVRRAHRTVVTRDKSAVHLIDGEDTPYKGSTQRDCARRTCKPMVSIFVRSDVGPAAADALKVEVMRRLSPYTQPYAAGIDPVAGRITTETETADLDAIRIDMEFEVSYQAKEWSLS